MLLFVCHLHNQVVHRSLVFALASDNKNKEKLKEILDLQKNNEMVTKYQKSTLKLKRLFNKNRLCIRLTNLDAEKHLYTILYQPLHLGID